MAKLAARLTGNAQAGMGIFLALGSPAFTGWRCRTFR